MRSLQGKIGCTVDALLYPTTTTRQVTSAVTEEAAQMCRSLVDLILCTHLPVTDHHHVHQDAAVACCAKTSLLLTFCANQCYNQIRHVTRN